MEDANWGSIRDKCRIRLLLQSLREFRTIEGLAIAIDAGSFRSPDSPRNMLYPVFFAASVTLYGIAPIMFGDELFKASFFWLD